jgi:uncharacterized protein YbjT (DUF2867 family)
MSDTPEAHAPRPVLVTGATGYIGSHVVAELLARGYPVRCMVRDRTKLERFEWKERVQVVEADAFDIESLPAALHEIRAAYYFIHSLLGKDPNYAARDHDAASNFGLVAKEEGVRRIVYLSGLGREETNISEHLYSRQEVGRVLASSGVPVTELRAAIVVGAWSLSFRMIRYLTDRIPLMITPKWVRTRVQPIAEVDVIRYLCDALEVPESAGRVLEIGGADILTYGDMMMGYADEKGLHRKMIPVPFLTPSLSAYWVDLVTPIPASLAHPLIEGLRSEVIVTDDTARRLFPFAPMSYRDAVKRALEEQPKIG